MVTVNVQVLTLPFTSVAVYVTVVVPIGNDSPLLWFVVSDAIPQLSVADGSVHVATAEQAAPALIVILEGQLLITGNWVSFTVTINVHVLTLPAASVAVYVTVVEPTLNVSPGA